MNLQDIYERAGPKGANKTNDDRQEITIRDPLAKRILDKARAKYAYTETDLEAFVKMMQDEQHKDREEIDDLEDRSDRLEKREQELEQELDVERAKRKKTIKQLHSEFDQEMAEINARTGELGTKETEYQQKVDQLLNVKKDYDEKFADIGRLDDNLDQAMASIQSSTQRYAQEVEKLKNLETEYRNRIAKLDITQQRLTQDMEDMQSEWEDIKADTTHHSNTFKDYVLGQEEAEQLDREQFQHRLDVDAKPNSKDNPINYR